MERALPTTSTIYIRLLEEAVTCIRPTEAERLQDGTYLVLATSNYDPTDEVWEFTPGSTVYCASIAGLNVPASYRRSGSRRKEEGSAKHRHLGRCYRVP